MTAPYDAKRRFLRTLAPTALMSHLKNSGFMVPAVRTAWRKMHSKWLAFWISAKLHIVGGARTAPGGNAQAAQAVAVTRAQTRQKAFRKKVMKSKEVEDDHRAKSMTMDQFLQPAPPAPAQGLHHHHQPP